MPIKSIKRERIKLKYRELTIEQNDSEFVFYVPI